LSLRGIKITYTCSNPACGKVFSSPLKTLNIQRNPTEPYAACPYCLTKITEIELEPDSKIENQELGNNEDPIENKETPSTCQYHMGYLSEREQKQQIPDECIVCKSIVECMLRKMRT
jgi:hypothetical protein